MSATICWDPIPAKRNCLSVGAPSSFIEAIGKAFGTFPVEISNDDLDVINAMAAVYGGDDNKNPYLELADAIEKYGTVRIWAEY